jgi:hypothetical protein
MINRKLIFIFCLFCSLNTAFSQETFEKKWEKGFLFSGCYTRMTDVSSPITNNGNNNFNVTSPNDRSWQFTYQPGFAIGAFGKRIISERLSLQGEVNFLLSRQKTILTETLTSPPLAAPSPGSNNQFFFQNQITSNGTIDYSNFYLQIPFSVIVNIDKQTGFEAGLFFTQSLINKSTQKLNVTTFTKVDNNTGKTTVYNPPLVVEKTDQPSMNDGLGWILGVTYAINDRFSVRIRYDGSMTGVSDFQDLRENRMSVGVLFHIK